MCRRRPVAGSTTHATGSDSRATSSTLPVCGSPAASGSSRPASSTVGSRDPGGKGRRSEVQDREVAGADAAAVEDAAAGGDQVAHLEGQGRAALGRAPKRAQHLVGLLGGREGPLHQQRPQRRDHQHGAHLEEGVAGLRAPPGRGRAPQAHGRRMRKEGVSD